MNLSQLRSNCLYWLDDLQATYFTSTQMNLFLNNAQQEVQKLLLQAGENYYLECVETTVVVNQPQYVLPQNFYKVHRIEVVLDGTFPNQSTRALEPITLNQQDLVSRTPSTPESYYLKRNRLIIWPAPDTARVMRLWYSYRVASMVNDSDVPDVPEEYHEFIAILATIDGLMKDGRDPSAMLLAKKKDYEELLKDVSEQRVEDGPRMVVMTGQDVVGIL